MLRYPKQNDFNPLPLYRGRHNSTYSDLLEDTFQSTSSIQRKTYWIFRQEKPLYISIHFLYTEEDGSMTILSPEMKNFNPLPLYRGRPDIQNRVLHCWGYFNPLPLYRGRLCGLLLFNLPLEFQSTSSIQRKTMRSQRMVDTCLFQSTSSIQRKTKRHYESFTSDNFNPLPLYRGRPFRIYHTATRRPFQSTSSIQRKTANINK